MPETEKRQMKIKCPSCESKLDVTEISPFTVVPCPCCGYEVTVPMRFMSYVLEERMESAEGVNCYRALDEMLDREVCVVVCDVSEDRPWKLLETYLENVRKLSSLGLPGVCAVYACGRYDNGVYAVYQLLPSKVVDGANGRRMTWKEARPLLLAFAETLQKAAENGIVHGALNERSFRLDDNGAPKICGFGEGALLMGRDTNDPYSSPERQAGGDGAVAADLYGFFVWAYRLLTGHLPPEGKARRMVSDEVPEVPEAVSKILEQMGSMSALRRPRGYLELLAALRWGGKTMTGRMKDGADRREAESSESGRRRGGVLLFCFMFLVLGAVLYWYHGTSIKKSMDGMFKPPKQPDEVVVTAEEPSSADVDGQASVEENVVKTRFIPLEYRKLRPHPEDMRFDEGKLQDYLKQIPEEYLDVEKDRISRIIGIREYLFSLLRTPCHPVPEKGLRLRDGSLLKGYVAMGSETGGLIVRPLGGERQTLAVDNVKLEELEWNEIWRMLDYYGGEREGKRNDGSAVQRMELFEHYLNSALICDWYDYRTVASAFVGKALKVNPKGAEIIEKFGLKAN